MRGSFPPGALGCRGDRHVSTSCISFWVAVKTSSPACRGPGAYLNAGSEVLFHFFFYVVVRRIFSNHLALCNCPGLFALCLRRLCSLSPVFLEQDSPTSSLRRRDFLWFSPRLAAPPAPPHVCSPCLNLPQVFAVCSPAAISHLLPRWQEPNLAQVPGEEQDFRARKAPPLA